MMKLSIEELQTKSSRNHEQNNLQNLLMIIFFSKQDKIFDKFNKTNIVRRVIIIFPEKLCIFGIGNVTCLRQINKNIVENNVKEKNKKVYEILTILH